MEFALYSFFPFLISSKIQSLVNINTCIVVDILPKRTMLQCVYLLSLSIACYVDQYFTHNCIIFL